MRTYSASLCAKTEEGSQSHTCHRRNRTRPRARDDLAAVRRTSGLPTPACGATAATLLFDDGRSILLSMTFSTPSTTPSACYSDDGARVLHGLRRVLDLENPAVRREGRRAQVVAGARRRHFVLGARAAAATL